MVIFFFALTELLQSNELNLENCSAICSSAWWDPVRKVFSVSGAYFLTCNFSGRHWPWYYIFSQWKYVVLPEYSLTFKCRGSEMNSKHSFGFLCFFTCVHQKAFRFFSSGRKTLRITSLAMFSIFTETKRRLFSSITFIVHVSNWKVIFISWFSLHSVAEVNIIIYYWVACKRTQPVSSFE